MNAMRLNGKNIGIILAVLLLLLLGFIGARTFLKNSPNYSENSWMGEWEISCFYQHEPNLVSTGTLHLLSKDSISGYMEIFLPKSTRAEHLALQNLSFSEDKSILVGEIVHDTYKIDGGYMQESLELQLKKEGFLSGKGACVKYCAEGTYGIEIVWEGNKIPQ